MTQHTESFAQLFEESLQHINMRQGALMKGLVISIDPEYITVNVGLKSEGPIPTAEFKHEEIKVGDFVEVVLESPENGFGETRLSHEKAMRARAWVELEKTFEAQTIVMGTIIERVKGGFTVELGAVRAFLPGSLVDVKPVRDPGYLEGKELEFKIIKMDRKRNNVVVSRRAVMEASSHEERMSRLDELQEGQEVIGIVKNITDYGAFVELGGIDGLLHITDMAWKRVKHPSELLKVGEELKVKVLKFDRDKQRVSLGLKQLGDDPWVSIAARYPVGTRLTGKVTNITDYGCFVELQEGVEGLVHMSEMDWTNKNVHPSKVVNLQEDVEVIVLDIDEERRRISLGIKQCKRNPWEEFSSEHEVGQKIKGTVCSITDFGLFVGLAGGIDGLVHLSDISWSESGEQAVRAYQKGSEVEAVILAIDPERERISLGIKQLSDDPMEAHLQGLEKDTVVKVTVTEVSAKQATVQLKENLTGVLRIADYSHERIKDLQEKLQVGDEIEVKIANVDRKNQQVYVSRKALEAVPKTETPAAVPSSRKATASSGAPTKTTLGDLLKEQMKNKDEE
ncbi:MAG: 30S ribosomal protein S1 [Gammaproteobacteria bacterium RIFCSPLOWO2_02_FULL_42_14]|nr:MAG: 30S ribosomal protein S1 [Gammaproteobacteria bacterium RIFCSPHIGHO2_02_FULL_42_43]OGT28223.1 MAG: 30S ribosomal protein S1 [Gammaproteobacteria bacterium RIFCSPHIGHO2_01_FULL_42_8]OGT52881.1 MAG: 30S ribosomal protein S1 [Gammaproteobacteria bacterium RIFCSPHIGHO2_12_FULL_41_25]OGT61346.1 MAG: 30S ribosomal protein S1 [Gammaproteobacteria bacterium RIFCSPLOWO2_02_FULL_42_14]OGT87275.1 MAG: 30S ribosomal protein S1 [Gammaproteobacteria bacterium RIFCSPLOWO2_12_FULL_42_18]